MPLPRTTPRSRPAALGAALAAALAVGGACAAARPVPAGPPEVFVEVLPRSAEVTMDGAALGQGSRAVTVADPLHRYAFRASAPGFAPAERADTGARLAGARVGLALRPVGFAAPVDLDDPASLADAAAALLRAGPPQAALEYAERAADLAPRAPALHRLAALAATRAGAVDRAETEYRKYVALAPDAADRAQVAAAIEDLRASQRAAGVEVRRDAPAGGGAR